MRNYSAPTFEIEKIQTVDIVATSFDGPTSTTKTNDPYEVDKF